VGSDNESKDAWKAYDIIIVGGGGTHKRFKPTERA